MDHDFVQLLYNHSLSLYGHTLAIFSTYRQCIELIDVNPNARVFKRLYTISPIGSGVERDRILTHHQEANYTSDPYGAIPLSHLKQKILEYMNYEESYFVDSLEVERMIIKKMQLYDHDHLLLRFGERPPPQTSKHFNFHVFYNISQQKVLKIYSQDSIELMKIVRSECDDFRNVRSLQIPWHASSCSSNEDIRASLDYAFNNSSGGLAARISRINSILPISSQSFSTSPYLDYSLFKYDNSYISTLEIPRNESRDPLEFLDRETNRVIFRAHCKFRFYVKEPLIRYIFHPFEPFFLSDQDFILNFHFYNPITIVELYSEKAIDNENTECTESTESTGSTESNASNVLSS